MKKTVFLVIIVLIAVIAGILYFVAPPKETPTQLPGLITGETMYPSEGVPALRVCAQLVSDMSNTKCVDVPSQVIGQRELPKFSLSVKPGTYWVYAELADPSELGLTESIKAYYTEFVRCGAKFECKNHSKIEIIVGPDQIVENIVPGDWY